MSNYSTVQHRQIQALLYSWLEHRLEPDRLNWLSQIMAIMSGETTDRSIFTAFSVVPKKIGKADLSLSVTELSEAKKLCPEWDPSIWSLDQTARALLLLRLPQDDEHQVCHWMEQLFTTAELQELVALHQTLPLLPHPNRYRFWADEGVRSHIGEVFQAIALHNPYPFWHFDEAAWNQMILKAIFIDAPLHPIIGLEQRKNPTLTRMLVDYIHERWAAHRRVTPEIWRLVTYGPESIKDLERGLAMNDAVQRYAIARCCLDSGIPEVSELFTSQQELQQWAGQMTWADIFQNRKAIISSESATAA